MNANPIEVTFEEAAAHKEYTVYADYFDEGLRVVIMRGPASVNCYLGVPMAHPLAGKPYDDIPIECHGGLTYAAPGNDKIGLDPAFYWYGYDYSHCDDLSFYELKTGTNRERYLIRTGKAWTPEMVRSDAWSAAYGMRKLMRLAESIALQAMGWRRS